MPLTSATSLLGAEWKNCRTNPAGEPELLLPLDGGAGMFQLRHQMILDMEVDFLPAILGQLALAAGTGGIIVPVPSLYSTDKLYTFKWRIMRGSSIWFEQEVKITLNLTAFVVSGYGSPGLSFTTWAPKRQEIRTTIIEGLETDAHLSVTTNSIDGVPHKDIVPPVPYTDAFGNTLPDMAAEFNALNNPSWRHTLRGTVLSESPILLDDNSGAVGLGTSTATIMAAWYSPIYKVQVEEGDAVDIVMDTMQSRYLREALYQFRFSGAAQVRDVHGIIDQFGGMGLPTLGGAGHDTDVVVRYGGEPYHTLETRDVLRDTEAASLVEDGIHQFWLGAIESDTRRFVERISTDAGRQFKTIPRGRGVIWRSEVSMPYEELVDQHTGERGVVAYDGNTLKYKTSRDNWSTAVPIVTLEEPEPMALTVTADGVLRVGNGRGKLFVSRDGGATWQNKSRNFSGGNSGTN